MSNNAEKRELVELNKRIDQGKKELSDVMVSANRSRKEHKEIEHDIATLKRTAKVHEDAVAEYKEKLEDNATIIDGQHELIQTTKQEIFTLQDEEKALKVEVVQIQDKIALDLKQAGDQIKAKMEAGAQELAKLKKLQADVAEDIQVRKELLDDLNVEYRDLVGKKEALETVLKTLEDNKTVAERELKTAQRAAKIEEERLETLTDQRNDLEDTLKGIQADIEKETEALKALEEETKTKQKELDDVESEYEIEKKKLVNIAERENIVNRKESQLKRRYEEWGIPWNNR